MSTPGGQDGYGHGYGQYPAQPADPTAVYDQTGQNTGSQPYQGFGYYPPTASYPVGDQGAPMNNFPTTGFPQQAPPPPPKKRTGAVVAALAVVLVLAVGAVLTVVLLNRGSDDAGGGPPPPTTTTSGGPTTTTSAPVTTTSDKPLNPDWQTVTVPAAHAEFDVPKDWRIETAPDDTVQIPHTDATIQGVATYKVDACPGSTGSFRAKVGFGAESSTAPSSAAKSVAQHWADALATAYDGTVSGAPTARDLRTDGGRLPATLAVATIKTKANSCNPPLMVVAVMSFSSGSKTESLVLFGDQNVSGAITAQQIADVLLTARPIG